MTEQAFKNIASFVLELERNQGFHLLIEIRANARQYSKAFQNICYEFLENPLLSNYPSKCFYDLFVIKYLVDFLLGKLRLTTHILSGLILAVQTFLHA